MFSLKTQKNMFFLNLVIVATGMLNIYISMNFLEQKSTDIFSFIFNKVQDSGFTLLL